MHDRWTAGMATPHLPSCNATPPATPWVTPWGGSGGMAMPMGSDAAERSGRRQVGGKLGLCCGELRPYITV